MRIGDSYHPPQRVMIRPLDKLTPLNIPLRSLQRPNHLEEPSACGGVIAFGRYKCIGPANYSDPLYFFGPGFFVLIPAYA